MESKFIDRLSNILKVKKHNSTYLSKLKYDEFILQLKELKESKKAKIPNGYKLINKYDIFKVYNMERFVVPMNECNQIKYYLHNEELYHILHETHLLIGHDGCSSGRRMTIHVKINKYLNINLIFLLLLLILYNKLSILNIFCTWH